MTKILLFIGCALCLAAGCAGTPDTTRFVVGAGDVVSAEHGPDAGGLHAVTLSLTPRASRRLARITEANLGEPLPVVVAGRVVCEPVVREVIRGPQLSISGQSEEEAAALVEALGR